MMEIGSSGHRVIGISEKPNLTPREARRNQEIQMIISSSGLTSSNSPLRFFVSFVVKGFSVSMIFALTIFVLTSSGDFGVVGTFQSIGVKA